MFEHKIPKFTKNRILTREILFSTRDIAYQEQLITYCNYSSGVILGCDLFEDDMRIGVRNGVLKFADRLYVLRQSDSLPYEPTDKWAVLKIRFGAQRENADFDYYTGELVLDDNTEILSNELEMGRFKLKKGSRLRTKYVDFADMTTECDTVNLVNVPQAAPEKVTIHPLITTHFAREAYPYIGVNPFDVDFCGQCLARKQALDREYIQFYISRRMKQEYREMDNPQIHASLETILKAIKSGGELDGKRRPTERKIMLV